ncbi:MAG: YciI family protein [Stenotrophobium sp.]
MKYLCLAYEEEAKLSALSRSEWDALRNETLAYVESLRKNHHLIATQALQSVRTATSVQVRHEHVVVTDGPYAETKEQLGGFFMIEARDLNEAIHLAAKWPSARIGTIEVRPVEENLRLDRRY